MVDRDRAQHRGHLPCPAIPPRRAARQSMDKRLPEMEILHWYKMEECCKISILHSGFQCGESLSLLGQFKSWTFECIIIRWIHSVYSITGTIWRSVVNFDILFISYINYLMTVLNNQHQCDFIWEAPIWFEVLRWQQKLKALASRIIDHFLIAIYQVLAVQNAYDTVDSKQPFFATVFKHNQIHLLISPLYY